MKAVLFAIRVAPKLWPLTRNGGAALLPIAGKPLIIHTIESLAMARITDVVVVMRVGFGDEVRCELGDGARWGMRFNYLATDGIESPAQAMSRLGTWADEELLVVRGEVLRTPMIAELLARAATVDAPAIGATIGGTSAGVTLLRPGAVNHSIALWDSSDSPGAWPAERSTIAFPGARLALIDSWADLYEANCDAIAGRFTGLMIPGRQPIPGVTTGRKTKLPVSAIKATPVFAGSRCHVAANAELMSGVILGDNVMIDRRATLRSALVTANTYVGELVEVNNAIVDGATLIHLDTGVVTEVTDAFLLARIRGDHRAPGSRSLDSGLTRLGRRLAASLRRIAGVPADFKAGTEPDTTVGETVHDRGRKSDGSNKRQVGNGTDGNYPRRLTGHTALPGNPHGLEATPPRVRQTQELISSGCPHSGRSS
jgi:NDP-sugar pyrophosphorylase family protein